MTSGLAQVMGLWGLNLEILDLVPPLAGPKAELSPVDLFSLSQPLPPPATPGTLPRPGTFCHGRICGVWGDPLKAKKGGG